MRPLVSIIIPVYNGADYLHEAIDSALRQTYKNIEVLVINDGSTDRTRAIALSYGEKIRYFEKENGGVSTALNLGIKRMHGDYFSWLSHDDVYLPYKIERQIETLESMGETSLAVSSRIAWMYMPSKEIKIYPVPEWIDLSKKRYSGSQLLFFLGITGCEFLIPRNYFKKYGGFDESLHCIQDGMKWYQIFRENDVLYVNDVLVLSRVHEKQVSKTNSGVINENVIYWKRIVDTISNENLKELGWSRYHFYYWMFVTHIHIRNFSDYVFEKLMSLEEPDYCEEHRRSLNRFLQGKGFNFLDQGEHLYLYCMGMIGQCFAWHLRFLGIPLEGVTDSSPKKWGHYFAGVQCVSPDTIPTDAWIIVAKSGTSDLLEELKKKYCRVISYDELMWGFMNIPGEKRYLQEFWNDNP